MNDMKNTEAEATAVDEGVQEALAVPAPTARWYRREARRLMIGKSGLSEAQKLSRVKEAHTLLGNAIALMEAEANVVAGEVEADD